MDKVAVGLFTPHRSLRQKAEHFPSIRDGVYKCVRVYMCIHIVSFCLPNSKYTRWIYIDFVKPYHKTVAVCL